MESIDRLRQAADELAQRAMPCSNAPDYADVRWKVHQLADAIESEVKANRVDAYTKGYDEGFASADDWAAQHEDAMAEHGWVRLPLDADGVPIHVGDWITGDWDAKAKVVAITSEDVYWWEPDGCHWCHAYEVRHHHAPTVDDMWHALTIDAKPMTDENMAESDWVRLPVGEDGDVLHIGELVDERLPFGGYAAPAPIDTMELSRGASGYVWMVKLDAENRALINPKLLRHHAPTVEDVLREMLDALDIDRCDDPDGTIAEYAAKLTLRGDE